MNDLAEFIQSKVSIDGKDLQIILSKFKQKTLKKGQFVLKKGQIANQYFYIKSGGLRFFYDVNNVENTSWVTFQNDFFTEISSLNTQTPTRFNIEAIEKTELLTIEKAQMEKLYKAFPAWQEFGRKIWETICIKQVDQILQLQTLTAEEKYLDFLNRPDFIQKVPINQLASILGIAPNSLSRIRRKIK